MPYEWYTYGSEQSGSAFMKADADSVWHAVARASHDSLCGYRPDIAIKAGFTTKSGAVPTKGILCRRCALRTLADTDGIGESWEALATAWHRLRCRLGDT
jgi:hypothetical protein